MSSGVQPPTSAGARPLLGQVDLADGATRAPSRAAGTHSPGAIRTTLTAVVGDHGDDDLAQQAGQRVRTRLHRQERQHHHAGAPPRRPARPPRHVPASSPAPSPARSGARRATATAPPRAPQPASRATARPHRHLSPSRPRQVACAVLLLWYSCTATLMPFSSGGDVCWITLTSLMPHQRCHDGPGQLACVQMPGGRSGRWLHA